ncbi:SMARCAL1 [Cordylochernes scorpioides]|uniref:SMARCAL1 n=1 Tax=Cordylochernes scorpioides TaxID=51811 RepID=A0ABY6K1X2_9ARAC|nr:SMARCAL1 [Cordylochernes scorpioides]
MESLSEREKRIIEEKRQQALALRASKIKPQGNVTRPHVVNPPYIKPPRLGSSSTSSHSTHTQPSQNISIKSAPNTKGNPSISAVCTLISKSRFQVDMVYHQESIAIFRTLPTRMYDATERKWNFNLSDHNQLEKAMKAFSSQVNFIPLPRYMINCLNQKPSQVAPDWFMNLDLKLQEHLMPFQKEGVHFAISRDGRVLLADDMGLGKTIQAIAIADYYREEWPLLIIAPSSMRYLWKEALTQWTSHLKPDEICTMDTGNKFDPDATVTVCSFDLATKKLTDLTLRKFRVIIFDESHFLKNYKSARTKAAQALAQLAKRVILLSGTPALSRPMELYTQIALVSPRLFTSVHVFGMRYCNGQLKPWGHDYSGSSNMKELQIILEETIMIRRMKSEVITQLPSKCRQMVLLDPSAVKTGSKSLKSMSKEIKKNDLKGMQWRGVLLEYFRETAVSKLPAICNYIKDLVDSDKKFVCFAHHQIVLNGICDTLEEMKCPHIRIDGSTPSEARKFNCDKFMFNDSCRVAVLSITAANAGITLTSANLVVFAELFWNPGILTQAEDRAHRIGQQDSVTVQYLVARNTADDHIWPMVQNKLNFLNKAGLSKDNFSEAETKEVNKQSTLEEFLELLTEDNILVEWWFFTGKIRAHLDGIENRLCEKERVMRLEEVLCLSHDREDTTLIQSDTDNGKSLEPLHELLHKKRPWVWIKECGEVIDKCKNCITSERMLESHVIRLCHCLATDASQIGVGAVLSHIIEGQERQIMFASRNLSGAEHNCSQIEKEALAIIYGVTKFHQFIYGRKFILITDHKPLVTILGPRSGIPTLSASRLQHWALILSAYTYDIKFRRTQDHGNADLSRFPVGCEEIPRLNNVYALSYVEELAITAEEIATETEKD